MILSGHQPNYLPGIQLFNKIALSDVFMHCGHLQYQRRSWHSHNFIGTGPLTIPTHDKFGETIDEVQICYDEPWQRKHLRAIELAYRGFPYFWYYFPKLRTIILHEHHCLGDLNVWLTETICEWLGIKTRILPSIYPDGDAIGKIIDMCQLVGADCYLSNGGARAYIGPKEEARMKDAGVTHLWQEFTPPAYGQEDINGGQLSVIDLLFRHGPKAGTIVQQSGRISRPGDGV